MKELLKNLVGSVVELSGAKATKQSIRKVNSEFEKNISSITSTTSLKVKTFLFVELVCMCKVNGTYELFKEKIATSLSFNEANLVNDLLQLQKMSPSKYAEQLRDFSFALPKKDKEGILIAIRWFLQRMPNFEHIFKGVLTHVEFESVKPV